MPAPVTTSELLLQQIADDLRDVKRLLQPGPARPAAAAPVKAGKAAAAGSKKSPSAAKRRADVDGR